MDNTVPVKRLSFVSFLSQAAIVMFNFTLVYYLRALGFSSAEVGAATSIYPVVYLLGCLFLPRLYPSISRKARVTASLLGMALSTVLFSFSGTKTHVYFILFLYGFFQSLLWTNIETWITTSHKGGSLTRTLTLFNLSWSSSVALSNLLGGILIEVSYPLSFGVSAFLFLTAAVTALSSPCGGDEETTADFKKNDEPLSPYRFLSWLGIFVIYTGYSMVIVVFPQYGLDALGFSSALSGRLLFYRGLSVCVTFLILKKYTLWQRGKGAIVFMLAAFSALSLAFNAVKTPSLLSLVFIAYGIVFALGYDLSFYHSALGGGRRHMRMVVHEVLITAGTTAGSFIGSIIYEYSSFDTLVISVTVLGLLSFFISLFSVRGAIADPALKR